MDADSPRAALRVLTDGRFLCVEVTNLGGTASFSGIVQPGRGSASAALARPALWNDSSVAERRIERGQSAVFRIAQRDRPPADHEDNDRTHVHPEGSQAWRMCYLKNGIGASLERICAVALRDGSTERDGVVLTVIADPPLDSRTAVKSLSLEGHRAIDLDTRDEFRVLDSPRHYHSKASH